MPLVIHFEKLRSQRAYCGLTYAQLAERSRKSQQTLADVLAGRGDSTLASLTAVAGALGLGVVIDFVPLEPPVDLTARLRAQVSQEESASAGS
jgi:transcriptional regulator with XRE-family HTH domain